MPTAETNDSGTVKFARYSTGYLSLFLDSVSRIRLLRNPAVNSVFTKQVYFTGIEAWPQLSIIATMIGIGIITQVGNLAGRNAELTGKILIWTVVREIGPLFSAIIIIARSGTAVVSELGSMKISGELDNLKTMGINPREYLILPRIAGVTMSIFILTFYFQMMAIAGGVVISAVFFLDVPLIQHIKGILSALRFLDVIVSTSKSLVFGAVISTIVCYQGLSVSHSITQIPQAATRAVMQCLFLVFVFDGLITFLSVL